MLSKNNKVRFISVLTIFVMLFSLAGINSASAAGTPGTLDPMFGTDGKVTLDFGGDEMAISMVLDMSGRILLAGFAGDFPNTDFGVARLNPDGSPDTSFGTGGLATVDFSSRESVQEVILDSSGRILLAGSTTGTFPNSDFAVARLNIDGTPDMSFGVGGKSTVDFGGWDLASAIKLDGEGHILLAGYTGNPSDFAIARLNSDGTLDTSFDQDGLTTLDFGTSEFATTMVLDGLGRILIAGSNGEYPGDFIAIRLNPDGTLDTNFGQDGLATVDFGAYDVAETMVLDELDRIVLAGSSGAATDTNFVAARLTPDGALDTGFGVGGQAVIDFGGSDFASAMVVDGLGHIVITGNTDANGNDDIAVTQLNNDGTLDLTFGVDGKTLVDFGGSDGSDAIALDGIDRILIAGGTDVNGSLDFALMRLNGMISSHTLTVDAGGPYSATEGGSVLVTATGSDSNNDVLTYAWDLDNDGTFETAGQSVNFVVGSQDGPNSFPVTVKASDPSGLFAVATTTIDVANVAPTATFTAPTTVNKGETFAASFSGASDPSGADTQAGFHYAFDCNGGSLTSATYATSGTSTSVNCTFPISGNYTVSGKVMDKDEGSNVYTAAVFVKDATSILDNFNRANGAIGSNWKGSTSVYRIASNRIDVRGNGPIYWKNSFGVNQEASVTLTTVDMAGKEQDLLLKVQGIFSPNWGSGVIEVSYHAPTNSVIVYTFCPDTLQWFAYSGIPVTFSNGDRLGAQALADGNMVIFKNGVEAGRVTLNAADQAFFNTRGGYIGLWFIDATNAFFDDFGGGNIILP